ncbi:MAG: GNAT family N-acetyltransferase [Bacteroidales bacterium]|nr:GNAT family N-acetyltransferase [Bacteroidales bacterium]
MIEIKRFGFDNKELLKISNSIRTKVFVEEQHVDPELEYENEEQGKFYLLYSDGNPIATARWRETEKGIKLERFAMLKEFRNQGLGSELLKAVLNDVQKLDKKIYLHSQLKAVSYYERAGFKKVGEKFTEAGIEHYLMELNQR